MVRVNVVCVVLLLLSSLLPSLTAHAASAVEVEGGSDTSLYQRTHAHAHAHEQEQHDSSAMLEMEDAFDAVMDVSEHERAEAEVPPLSLMHLTDSMDASSQHHSHAHATPAKKKSAKSTQPTTASKSKTSSKKSSSSSGSSSKGKGKGAKSVTSSSSGSKKKSKSSTSKQAKPSTAKSSKSKSGSKKSNATTTTTTTSTSKKASAGMVATPVQLSESEIKQQYTEYKKQHKRQFKSTAHEAARYAAFKKRLLAAAQRNADMRMRRAAKGLPPPLKPVFNPIQSPIADVEEAVFRARYLGGRPKPRAAAHKKVKVAKGGRSKPPSTAKASTATKSKAKSKSKSKSASSKARFVQTRSRSSAVLDAATTSTTTPIGAIPSTKDVKPPSDTGNNKGKGLKGGDNKGKGLKGGNGDGSGDDHNNTDISKQVIDMDVLNSGWRPSPASPMFGFQAPNARMIVDISSQMFPAIVRNQGVCRSCWATTAVEHFQAVLVAISMLPFDGTGKAPRLSVQQVIDCNVNEEDHGCDGGTVVGAFDYMTKNGVVIAPHYPYPQDGSQHACAQPRPAPGTPYPNMRQYKAKQSLFLVPPCLDASCPPNPAYEERLVDFFTNPPYKRATTGKPVAIPVVAYVDATAWDSYSGGVFPASACSSAGTSLTHIVQIVGYGMDTNTDRPFWLIRNSWGAEWGEKGHIRLPYGVNACGLFNYIIYLEAIAEEPQNESYQKLKSLQEMINNSPRMNQMNSMQAMLNRRP